MQLITGGYYHVADETNNTNFVLFRFDGENKDGITGSPYVSYSIGNMNKHWGRDSFTRKDGKNTYPFEFNTSYRTSTWANGSERRWVDIKNREVREATSAEIHWLESCAKSGMMLLKEEYRQYKLEQLVGIDD